MADAGELGFFLFKQPGTSPDHRHGARKLAIDTAGERVEALRRALGRAGVLEEQIEIRRPRLPQSADMQQGFVALSPRRRPE